MTKAVCGGDLDGFCKGLGGVRPCPDHEKVIMRKVDMHAIAGAPDFREPKE